jgi:hypothetical protein
MRSAYLTLAAGVAVLLVQAHPAAAQFNAYGNMLRNPQGGPLLQPSVSPYLNMTMGGGPLGYQLRTLPQFQQQNFEASVLQNWPTIGNNTPAAQGQPFQEFPTLGQTGHLSAFQAYGSYYNYGQHQRPYYPLNPYLMRTLPR